MANIRPVIRKLGYPLWFTIVFFILTIAVPIGLVMWEGLKAPPTTTGSVFKVSFMIFSICIVAWFFIRRFLIVDIESKLLAKQAALEHDYSIKVGDAQAIKYMWYHNQATLAIFNLINVALYGGFMFIIMLGVSSALIETKQVVLIITGLYVLAYALKFMVLTLGRDDNVEAQ